MRSHWNIYAALAVATVLAAPLAAQERVKEGAHDTSDAVVHGSKTVAAKTEEGLSKTGEVMTDAWVTTRVHARFVDEALLKDSDISVATNNHLVTLTGTVRSSSGRSRAASVALHTEGVHRVVNHLTIRSKHHN